MSKIKFDENFTLEGKNSIITGASKGIGLAIAKMFSRKGSNIIAYDIVEDLSHIEKYVKKKGKTFLGFTGDIRDKKTMEKMVSKSISKLGKIDVLVNCAGVAKGDNAESMKEEDWDFMIDVNLKGPFLLSQIVGRTMIANKGGKIINIASMSGTSAFNKHVAYATSKAGLIMLTKVFALEWGKYNINVNCISPTIIMTDMSIALRSRDDGKQIKKLTPLGRYGYPEEIAVCAVFLASDASGLITGENLIADGGYSVN